MKPSRRNRLLLAAALLALLAIFAPRILSGLAAGALRSRAASHGWQASWRKLRVAFPATLRVTGFRLTEAAGGRLIADADSFAVSLAPLSLLTGRPAPGSLFLAHATVAVSRARTGGDTLAPPPALDEDTRHEKGPAAARVRHGAETLVRALFVPARSLPRITLRDVTLGAPAPGAEEDDGAGSTLRLDALELSRHGRATTLAARGAAQLEREVRFDLRARWADDDRLEGEGRALFRSASGSAETLRVALDGTVRQDRKRGVVSVGEGTRATLGRIPFEVEARVARRGPALALGLAADSLTGDAVRASVPASLLGPLTEVGVRGSWDYRLTFRLDLAHLDSTDFHADVIPHGLALDPARTALSLLALDQPFVATIHLPKGRLATRDLSPSNPHFVTLDAMDSILVHAVLANEDGGFFRHHGFNTDAVRLAIVHNLRAGAYRRGAGTITMQLARNLWLGHERTLARKAQEVVLAWMLEHLTWTGKRRLLEIYLNIIEWGPGIHGADEAAEYYFGRSAEHLTVAQSLFLTTVIPAPARWQWKFAEDGRLRPTVRAQMHFIGRAMIAKGWLSEGDLPPEEALDVEVTGLARDVLFPPEEAKKPGFFRSLFP